MPPKRARQTGQIMRVKEDAIGTKVVNSSGEDIGKIEEVVMDLTTARVTYAVLSFGGFLGIGDKLFAVPWVSFMYAPCLSSSELPNALRAIAWF
jgi:sporulation protein YlmC with PRC-barrel domain